MKTYVRVLASIVLIAVISSSFISCGKISEKTTEADITDMVTVDSSELEELPDTEYEVSEVGYLSEIEHISEISPLNGNLFLVISDPSGYGDAVNQKLYIADDQNSSITEITPDLNLNETAYYSVLGTKYGKIFIAAIEPKYGLGKNPGNDVEENYPQDHIDYLFSKAKKVNYKLFELNTNGEIISENKINIDFDPEMPVNWLKFNDYWDDKIVVSAMAVKNGDKNTAYYVVNKNGDIAGQIENYIPYYGPSIEKVASDGRLCFIGSDYDTDEPYEKMIFYDKGKLESDEMLSVRSEDFGCNTRTACLIAGSSGHGDDLLYLSSSIGLFSLDKNGNYKSIINYIDSIPQNVEVDSVLVLDNNSVLVLGTDLCDSDKTLLYKFKSISTKN